MATEQPYEDDIYAFDGAIDWSKVRDVLGLQEDGAMAYAVHAGDRSTPLLPKAEQAVRGTSDPLGHAYWGLVVKRADRSHVGVTFDVQHLGDPDPGTGRETALVGNGVARWVSDELWKPIGNAEAIKILQETRRLAVSMQQYRQAREEGWPVSEGEPHRRPYFHFRDANCMDHATNVLDNGLGGSKATVDTRSRLHDARMPHLLVHVEGDSALEGAALGNEVGTEKGRARLEREGAREANGWIRRPLGIEVKTLEGLANSLIVDPEGATTADLFRQIDYAGSSGISGWFQRLLGDQLPPATPAVARDRILRGVMKREQWFPDTSPEALDREVDRTREKQTDILGRALNQGKRRT